MRRQVDRRASVNPVPALVVGLDTSVDTLPRRRAGLKYQDTGVYHRGEGTVAVPSCMPPPCLQVASRLDGVACLVQGARIVSATAFVDQGHRSQLWVPPRWASLCVSPVLCTRRSKAALAEQATGRSVRMCMGAAVWPPRAESGVPPATAPHSVGGRAVGGAHR